jgi:hypothetical protein
MEPDAPSPAIDAARELALSLAAAAGAGDLAEAAGEGDPGALLLDTLLTHELAIGHTLMARLAAQVDAFIGRIGQAPAGEADRAVAEVTRLTGAVARMMERYRLGFQTLAKVRSLPNGAKQVKIVRLAWGDGTWDDNRRDGSSPGDEGSGSAGGDNGGSSGNGGGSVPPPTGAAPPPVKRPTGFGPGFPTLPYPSQHGGRLRNGNPSGDLAAVRRCGARTRAGGACRQPAMANGRCRLHGGKSTGPRTPAGLAASRAARLRHGGHAGALVALRSEAACCGRRIDRLIAARRAGLLAGQGVDPGNRPSSPGAGDYQSPIDNPSLQIPMKRDPFCAILSHRRDRSPSRDGACHAAVRRWQDRIDGTLDDARARHGEWPARRRHRDRALSPGPQP